MQQKNLRIDLCRDGHGKERQVLMNDSQLCCINGRLAHVFGWLLKADFDNIFASTMNVEFMVGFHAPPDALERLIRLNHLHIEYWVHPLTVMRC